MVIDFKYLEANILTEDDLIKLALTTLMCGLIGAEREYRSKSAGFKTIIMIGLGATLFTLLSTKIGANSSPDRIASNIVTGIGFFGAGVIFKEDNRVKGLTTASIIWIVAAIGMAIGSGHYHIGASITGVVLLSLMCFPLIEKVIDKNNTVRSYRIMKKYEDESLDSYEKYFKSHNLNPTRGKQSLANGMITGTWLAKGPKKKHESFVDSMLRDKTIVEFDF